MRRVRGREFALLLGLALLVTIVVTIASFALCSLAEKSLLLFFLFGCLDVEWKHVVHGILALMLHKFIAIRVIDWAFLGSSIVIFSIRLVLVDLD